MNDDNLSTEIVFSYEVKKDDKVLIYWYDKLLKTLSGENAKVFLRKIEGVDDLDSQLILRKAVGNLKTGKNGNANFIVIRGTHYFQNKS